MAQHNSLSSVTRNSGACKLVLADLQIILHLSFVACASKASKLPKCHRIWHASSRVRIMIVWTREIGLHLFSSCKRIQSTQSKLLRYTLVLTYRYNRQLTPVESYWGYHPVPADILYGCTTSHVETRVQLSWSRAGRGAQN